MEEAPRPYPFFWGGGGPGGGWGGEGPPGAAASSVLRSGLVVRYSVNEQVAGRFEVLLASSIARRIGLHGAPATGLAKGNAGRRS